MAGAVGPEPGCTPGRRARLGGGGPDRHRLADPPPCRRGRCPCAGDAEPTGGGASADGTGEHLVVPGDTLREIADAELGDPERYPEIFEASQAIEQPGGARLTDPDLILPGWTLRLPDATPVPAEPAAPSGPADTPHPNGSAPSTTTTTGPPPTTDPPSTETSVATTAPAPPTSEVEPASPPSSVDAGSDDDAPAKDDKTGSVLSALGTALAGITGATVLATGLAALIRQRRRRPPHTIQDPSTRL